MWSTLSSSMELTICQSDRGMSIIKGNIIKKIIRVMIYNLNIQYFIITFVEDYQGHGNIL